MHLWGAGWRRQVLEKLCEVGEKEEPEGPDQQSEDDALLPRISWSFLSNSTGDGGRETAAGASYPITLQFSEAQKGVRGETRCADGGVYHFNSGEFVSREGIFKAIMGYMNTGTHAAAAAAANVSPVANHRCLALLIKNRLFFPHFPSPVPLRDPVFRIFP